MLKKIYFLYIQIKWKNLMKEIPIQNKSGKIPVLEELQTKEYGVTLIIKIPPGLSRIELEKNKETIETFFNTEIEIGEENKEKINIDIFADTGFKNYEFIKTNNKEIYVANTRKEEKVILNFAKFPHLLIVGTTGSGKSKCLELIIKNLLKNNCKIKIMQLEKAEEIRKFENKKGIIIKKEIEEIKEELKQIEKMISKENSYQKSQYLIIDEYSFVNKDKEIREIIYKIAALGRTKNVFLILATQRPSKEFITPEIRCLMNNKIILRNTKANAKLITEEELKDIEKLKTQEGYIVNNKIQRIYIPTI